METRIGFYGPVWKKSNQHVASCEELVDGANGQVEARQLECVEQQSNNAVPVFYGRPNRQLLQHVHAFFTHCMCTQNMGYEVVLAKGSSQEFNMPSKSREISISFPSVHGVAELYIGPYNRGFFIHTDLIHRFHKPRSVDVTTGGNSRSH